MLGKQNLIRTVSEQIKMITDRIEAIENHNTDEAMEEVSSDVEEALDVLNTINDSEPFSYETTILDDSAMWDLLDKNKDDFPEKKDE